MAPVTDLYDNLAQSYDLMISWQSRLRREKPFLTSIFKQHGVRRILDTACGTGMHAIAFHDWGYHVTAADLNGKMIETAIKNSGDRKIQFKKAGFTDDVGGMFDAVTCLGNSLPHVLTDEDLEKSLASMYNALLPGGVLIVHGNNYDRILARRERFMPLAQRKVGGREYLFLRIFDFHGDTLTFNVITLVNQAGEWRMFPDSSTHRALTRDLLVGMIEKVGFVNLQVSGSFGGEAFDKLESDNLIVVAQRPHTFVSRPIPEPVRAIDRIPIQENGEPLVDLEKEGFKAKKPPAFARKTVAGMLKEAASMLPEGYSLLIRGAFRSLEHQRTMYENFCRKLTEEHPDWPKSQIRRELNKFLAPPDSGHPPGHTTGGAVDVTVLGPDGEELDMTSTIPLRQGFGGQVEEVHWTLAMPTYSKHATPRAAKNRQLLVDLMTSVGFSNYPGEWWHYSYGESAWALRTGAPYAIYGAAPDPVNAGF